MLDLFSTLKSTPLPVILTVGGIIFLFLGIVGNIKQLTTEPLPGPARKVAAGTGAVLLVAGIVLYVIPAGPSPAVTGATPTAVAQQPAVETAAPLTETAVPGTQEAGAASEVNAQGYPIMVDDKGASMVLIPGGAFLMGSDTGFPDEKPVRRVALKQPYWLDVYEVTNKLYKGCVDQGVCQPPKQLATFLRSNYYGSSDFAEYPVVFVDWTMATTFCRDWRGGRLPTEAEWEFAARGTDQRPYAWGSSTPDCTMANFAARTDSQCVGDTQSVANYPAGLSPFGVYNMMGNVWEWVADWYGPYAGLPSDSPTGNAAGSLHTLRGGGWASELSNVTTTVRYSKAGDAFDTTIGFRCARSQ